MASRRKRKGASPPRQGGNPPDRYQHRIPGRNELLDALNRAPGPISLREMGERFGIRTDSHTRALENRLRAMVRDGQLIRNRAGKFCIVEALDLVTGRVSAHRDGYGFLRRDDGDEDLYLSAREMRTLWEGDRIAARVSAGRRDGQQGHLVEVLARAKTSIVGQFRRERGINYVLEHGDERTEVLIGRADAAGARPGDIVRVEIIEYPTHKSHAIGRVSERLGRHDAPGVETVIAIEAHGIPDVWPDAVGEIADSMPSRVPAAAKRDRIDLRDIPLVTIDGADAKDFDDAVYCERRGNGWRLLVAIADVSHYVEPDDPLDREARLRGTSVYFPDRVVPMLPEVLSNGLCSLNPQVDRLCVVCEMEVTAQGSVRRSKFYDAVMRSHARLTYEQANEILAKRPSNAKQRRLKETLEPLRAVYLAFSKARKRRGTIDFDLSETRIELDDAGKVERISPRERLMTHRLIEECMIAANVEAAKRLRATKLPALYRVHELPDPSKLEELRLFAQSFGISLPPDKQLKPADLSRMLQGFEGKPEQALVNAVLLRSMSKADYRPKNAGHFGLALGAYAHFTSPIRRYPDLLVHRAIKWSMRRRSPKAYSYDMAGMTRLGEICSAAERRADEAVWDVEEQLKCQYMSERVGEDFEVVVASVVAFGLFVRVPALNIDGLVHVSTLPPDYYHRDPSGTELSGERTGRRFRIADTLTVRLSNVDLDDRKIDFVPAGEPAAVSRQRQRQRGRRRG